MCNREAKSCLYNSACKDEARNTTAEAWPGMPSELHWVNCWREDIVRMRLLSWWKKTCSSKKIGSQCDLAWNSAFPFHTGFPSLLPFLKNSGGDLLPLLRRTSLLESHHCCSVAVRGIPHLKWQLKGLWKIARRRRMPSGWKTTSHLIRTLASCNFITDFGLKDRLPVE